MSRYPHPVFSWSAPRLSSLSLVALNELREAVISDPANDNGRGQLFLYTPSARRKLDALSYAVYFKLREGK